jgi:hypothetical protein
LLVRIELSDETDWHTNAGLVLEVLLFWTSALGRVGGMDEGSGVPRPGVVVRPEFYEVRRDLGRNILIWLGGFNSVDLACTT